jgi:hypothetical protein|tara:strand:+ start:380 stop:619 length:240 start_codon:yes stop_codon:yes gene_type:complete
MTGDLSRVRCRLETAVSLIPGEPANMEELAEKLEMVGVQIIDSEFESFRPGELAEYIGAYLYVRQLELGLIPFPDPSEE